MTILGTWKNPTIFGAFQLASIGALALLYAWKVVGGNGNPVVKDNPFDTGNVLAFPRSMGDMALPLIGDSTAIDWALFAPINAPTPHGKSFTSCNCSPTVGS